MEKFRKTVAKNISSLRVANGLTQADLGDKINYSDKAVSKWERGESLPDLYVLKQLADIFQVKVDYFLEEHQDEKKKPVIKNRHKTICQLSFIGTYTLALLVFVVLWLCNILAWQVFVYAIPVSMIVLIVENSIWGKPLYNFLFISGLIWGIIATVYIACLQYNWWQLFLLGVPAELITALCFKFLNKKRR